MESAPSAKSAVAPSGPSSAKPEQKPPPPTTFPPAVAKTIAWLQERFCSWYAANPPPPPDRFARREFGYMGWPERPGPPPFVRHIAFESVARFHEALARGGPHSVYYSTAYYRRPGEMKMADKEWLGAELIFDLDADHLADVEKAKAEGREVPLEEQLRQVKVQFKRLLDEFLFGDFGLSDKDVWITFSGGRGYHAHVTEARLMQMGSRERREVVDYITGKAPVEKGTDKPDLSAFIWEEPVGVKGSGEFAKAVTRERMAPASTPGWPGRITRTLAQTLRANVLEADPKVARKWLLSIEGIGETRARSFIERFDARVLERIEQGFIDQGRVVRSICEDLLRETSIPLAKGETDEPVTADTKRLIRLPGSLHGKSGLRVVTLHRDELDGFDPLRDAVAFSKDPVRIVPRNDQEMSLGGERVAVRKGEAVEVPETHAVFWCARQAGTITTDPPAGSRAPAVTSSSGG